MTTVTNSSAFRTTTQGPSQTTRSTLKDILRNVKSKEFIQTSRFHLQKKKGNVFTNLINMFGSSPCKTAGIVTADYVKRRVIWIRSLWKYHRIQRVPSLFHAFWRTVAFFRRRTRYDCRNLRSCMWKRWWRRRR